MRGLEVVGLKCLRDRIELYAGFGGRRLKVFT